MFKKYNAEIIKILESSTSDINWKDVNARHTLMLSWIQHERLIHLLVTIFVGITMCLFCITTIVTDKVVLVFLDIPLMMLFIGYIFHYMFLENTTQRWYQLDELIKRRYI